jgi:predicted Fe-Mo cluster-binding NifX family protein
VDVDGQQEIHRQTVPVKRCAPEQIPELLSKERVELVICGGMNDCFQELFQELGISVIWGIIGDVEDVLAAYQAHKLVPGMGSCLHRGRAGRRACNGPRRWRTRRDESCQD